MTTANTASTAVSWVVKMTDTGRRLRAVLVVMRQVATGMPIELAAIGGLALGEAVKVLLRVGWRMLTAPKGRHGGP